jgi:predicted nucleic acid-binding protein
MTFDDLLAGDSIFVDANTLVYHFARHPQFGASCTKLVKRIENFELIGLMSTHVLSDVAHRMMTIEAIDTFGWPVQGIGRRLRRHPDEIAKLTGFRRAVEETFNLRIKVVPVTPHQVSTATLISQHECLLSGDALIIAVMREHGLVSLASHDADFDRVAGIVRYAPA